MITQGMIKVEIKKVKRAKAEHKGEKEEDWVFCLVHLANRAVSVSCFRLLPAALLRQFRVDGFMLDVLPVTRRSADAFCDRLDQGHPAIEV
jgi:hypothetical protein